MIQKQREQREFFSIEDLQYLRVALALAFGSEFLTEMPKTEATLEELSEKVERIYHMEVNEY